MSKLLGNPELLRQGGGAYGCPSRDNPGIAKLLGNCGILGQGTYWCPSLDNPGTSM